MKYLYHLLHHLFYYHIRGRKDEIGTFTMCVHRLSGKSKGVFFKPDYQGAYWHTVPSIKILENMTRSSTREEAMAILRSGDGGANSDPAQV